MLAILRITFPFFALIGAGYLSVTRRWVLPESVGGLNRFVLYIALPCLLFKFSAGLDLETLARQPFVPIYGITGLVLFAMLLGFGRMRQAAWRDLSFVALVSVFPNTGFIGVPMVVSMLGPRAATPAVAIVLFDMLVTSSLAVATSTLDGHDLSNARAALARALRGVRSNPMLWSMLAGMAVAATHVPVGPVWREPIWMMADAATPIALFTIGGILARPRVPPSSLPTRPVVTPFVIAKLAGHPLLMAGSVHLAGRLGWPLEPWVGQSLILLAALPGASNVSFLADRMGADASWVARVILWTTVAAFLTFSLWGWWVLRTV